MIGYVTVGTNDLDRSAAFYDKLFEPLGGKRFMEFDSFIAWSNNPKAPGFCVTKPYDGKPATVGNGVMIALHVPTTEKVDQMHALALELGGSDEGAPGARSANFYGGYFRDPDGNKLNFFCITGEQG